MKLNHPINLDICLKCREENCDSYMQEIVLHTGKIYCANQGIDYFGVYWANKQRACAWLICPLERWNEMESQMSELERSLIENFILNPTLEKSTVKVPVKQWNLKVKDVLEKAISDFSLESHIMKNVCPYLLEQTILDAKD